MGAFLLDKDLKLASSPRGSTVEILAPALTHTVLMTLDSERKRSVLIFLHQNKLIEDVDVLRHPPPDDPITTPSNPIIGLQRADLSGAYLQEADLNFANLYRANLEGADLRSARLYQADLRAAKLKEAKLQKADLSRAYLTQAILEGANLAGANLRFANLKGVNLVGVRNLTDAQLRTAYGDSDTKLPEGFDMPKSWLQG
jgi:Pentapeptide repeats (8 copies)